MSSTGKRLRFEVLKRDGFRCRYCGANAASTLLHVDHVVPIAEGGTDDPENLVAACADCNLGKSSVSLDASPLGASASTDAMLEHAEQIRAYLAAVKEVELARGELVQMVIDRWVESVDPEGMQRDVIASLPTWIQDIGLERVMQAVDVIAKRSDINRSTGRHRYFIAVMRNMRDGTTPTRSR